MTTLFRIFFLMVVIHTGLFHSIADAKEKHLVFHRIISLYPAHTENLVAL